MKRFSMSAFIEACIANGDAATLQSALRINTREINRDAKALHGATNTGLAFNKSGRLEAGKVDWLQFCSWAVRRPELFSRYFEFKPRAVRHA